MQNSEYRDNQLLRASGEIEKKKKSISFLKKIITAVIITPVIPIVILVHMLLSGEKSTANISVDERFRVSSLIVSPYRDIIKSAYDYSFAFCGDPHMQAEGDGHFPKLDEVIRQNKTGFVIFGGDLTFLGKEEEFKNFANHANALTVPSYPAIGNHDIYNGGWSYYWREIVPSAYSFYGGNAKFIVIDTADGEIGEEQMEWIKTELKSNKQPLLFVISHMPIYGGEHNGYEFPRTEERTALIELFEKYEVNYVLEGHYHAFVEEVVNGVHYITSGSFSEGLLDAGQRHFLLFRIYGPSVTIEKVLIESDTVIEYRTDEI